MKIQVNKQVSQGNTRSVRKLELEFPVGDSLEAACKKHGEQAVFKAYIEGACGQVRAEAERLMCNGPKGSAHIEDDVIIARMGKWKLGTNTRLLMKFEKMQQELIIMKATLDSSAPAPKRERTPKKDTKPASPQPAATDPPTQGDPPQA